MLSKEEASLRIHTGLTFTSPGHVEYDRLDGVYEFRPHTIFNEVTAMFSLSPTHLPSAASPRLRTHVLTILLAIAGLTGGMARAQMAGTGAINGTVQDPTGAVVANATVTATNVDTNVETKRTTTKAGDYNITPLTPGDYVVSVSAPGFEGYKQEKVNIDALVTVTLNIKLTVGRASETVTVTSAPPLLETADATLGAVMDNEMYSALPLMMGAGGNADQRRATDFEYLMPGVQGNFTNGNATSNSGIVNGSGPSGGVSEIYIDGINLPEADGVGDPRFTWTAIGVDSIDQFQVQTAGVSAQFGGQGVQNYSIKSGGNAYHGSIYEYLRNTFLDAWPFQQKVPTINAQGTIVQGGIKPREIMNEFGIVLSGPIIKDKLFLFGNYGQYRYQAGAKISTFTIPTAAMLGYTQNGTPLGYADYSGYAAANASGAAHIYDPATQVAGCSSCTRTQFNGLKNGVPTPDVIPASRFSKASNYYNQYMLQYEPLVDQNTYTGNLFYGTPIGLANWYSTGRIDYNQSSKNQISAIIAFGRQAATGSNSGSGLKPPFNASQIYNPVTTVDILKDTYTVTPHVVNQFAIGYGRYQSDSVTPNRQVQYAATTAGITNMPSGQASDGFPGITYSGGFDAPAVQGGYAWNSKINNTFTTTDNVQWVFGKNNLTLGGQYVITQFNYSKVETFSGPMAFTFAAAQTGQFPRGTSINTNTGSSVATYMLGAASAGSTSAGVPELGTRWRDPSFWAQDDYKLNSKITLNLGLRWDIYPSIQEVHNNFTFLNPNGINSITGNKGTLQFAGNGDPALYCNCSSPSSVYKKNIAPRIGIAYAMNSKTVIKASYNVNFARGNWTSGSQSGSPSTLGVTPSASAPGGISSAPAFYWDPTNCVAGAINGVACGWTGSVVPPTAPAGGTSLAEYATTFTSVIGNAGSSTVTYFDPYRGSRTPEYINWTFGVQRQLTRDMSLTATYVGSQGHFLSVSSGIGSRNNKLTEAYAALAGYNYIGTTATACSGASCGYPSNTATTLLGAKSTAAALAAASGLGFTPPNPYTTATYYASNTVAQYYYAFPQFSGVSDTTSFVGNTNYNALQMTLSQRAAHGLQFMLNYTYSKAIDNIGTVRVYDNSRLDRSLSTTDQPQNFNLSGVYALPFGKGKIGGDNRVVSMLAGGWSLSSIFTYNSGSPILFTGSGCGGSSILGTCMPNIVPGQANRINGSYGHAAGFDTATTYNKVSYLNPNAFTVNGSCASASGTQFSCPGYGTSVGQLTYVGNGPAVYVPGNASRVAALNTWSMSRYNVDMSIKRIFPVWESVKLQFQADFLNLTNHPVFGAPSGGVNGSGFGLITSMATAYNPRYVQLSASLSF